eukprot:gene8660-607_t
MYQPTVNFYKKFKQGPIPVTCLKSLENKTFASGSIDSIFIWDLQTGKKLQTITDTDFQNLETGPVKSMDLLPNGNLVHNIDQYIKVWNLNHYKCLQTLKTDRSTCLVAVSDEFIIVSIDEDIKIINLTTGEIEKELSDNTENFQRFSKNQKDIINSKTRESLKQRPTEKINDNDFSTSKTLTLAEKKQIKEKVLMQSKEITSICKLSDDKLLTGSEDKTVKIWNLKTNKCIKTLRGHQAEIKSLAAMKDDGFVSASKDGMIKIWDSKKQLKKTISRAHASTITSLLDFGNYLISGSFDKTVKIWEKINYNCVAILKHKDKILSLIDLDGHSFAVGCNDGMIICWKFLPEISYKTINVLKQNNQRFKDLTFNFKVEKKSTVENENNENEDISTEKTSLLGSNHERKDSTCCCLVS